MQYSNPAKPESQNQIRLVYRRFVLYSLFHNNLLLYKLINLCSI